MLKKMIAAAALAAVAGTANAAVLIDFAPSTGGPAAGETLLADFNNSANDGLVQGSGFTFLTGNSNQGALPGAGDGSRYLSVLSGGNATIDFGVLTSGFSMDIGSVDDFNFLTLVFDDGTSETFDGFDLVAVPDGNQQSGTTNGRFTFSVDDGRKITGIQLASNGYSFEVDNIAISAVPEPATWAMMIAGFAMVGFGLRGRRRGVATVTA